jgi:hypothetical protein
MILIGAIVFFYLVLMPAAANADVLEYNGSELWSNLSDVEVSGNYAYLLHWNGLMILDVSDPNQAVPIGKAFCPGQGHMIKLQGNYAYLADGNAGMITIDISNPEIPAIINTVDVGNAIGILIEGNYAYVSVENYGLKILDITDPGNATQTGSITMNGPWACIGYYDGYLVMQSYEPNLLFFDVHDPARPRYIGSYNSVWHYFTDMQVIGSVVYLAHYDHFEIIDISDIHNPVSIGNAPVNGGNAMFVQGSLVYVVNWDSQIETLDISDPSNPTKIGDLLILGSQANGKAIDIAGNYAYVLDDRDNVGHQGDMHILDITNSSEPLLRSTYTTNRGVYNVVAYGNYAYATGTNLTIMDISNPAEPEPIRSIESFPDGNSQVYGNHLYVFGWNGLNVYNILDPINPVLLDVYVPHTGSFGILAISGNYAYIPNTSFVDVLDISNPSDIVSAGHINLTVADYSIWLTADDNRLYLAYGRYLYIYNISDPVNAVLLGSYDLGEYLIGRVIAVKDNFAYLTTEITTYPGRDSAIVIDASNPASPQHVWAYPMPGSGVYEWELNGDMAYLYGYAHYYKFVMSFFVGFPSSPYLLEYRELAGEPHDLAFSGSNVLIANACSFLNYTSTGFSCPIYPGDANGNGIFNGIDIVYAVNYLKGTGPYPPNICTCGTFGNIFAAADGNGDCTFNGLDVTYNINYLKGSGSAPAVCAGCYSR